MYKIFKSLPKSLLNSYRNYAKQNDVMKYLNVAEKHDAAKSIAALLSNGTARRREGYSVYNKIFDFEASVNGRNSKMVMTSVSGHLLVLEFLTSYRNWRNIDPKVLFEAPIRKTCPDNYLPVKRTLEREIRGCQGLIVWTDCDREGENICFEIVEVCRAVQPNIVVYRATFSEITQAAVRRALQQLGQPDKRLSDAVDVRSELDLRTGAAITRFQTMRLQRLFPDKIADKLISYGSCQIPTLGFVVERYKEVEAFVSEAFWKIRVNHTIEDLTVEYLWARNRLFDKEACENYLLLCLSDPMATVESVTVKPKSKWRPIPMDTVEMEKLACRKLKLSAKETMTIAEKLYTKGIISYPRTETNEFSKEIDLRSLVEQQTSSPNWGSFAQRVLEWCPNPRNGSKSDQAHPPIHPTKLVTNLEGNEGRVYELVCRHFLACVSKNATGLETVVTINIAGEKFTATGLCIHERNYLDVYIYEKWNAKQIHAYEQGQVFEPTDISMQEGATTAPPLLTEADLIALMEKHGIGTDATHADHINTIKERGYIGVVDNNYLVPGVIGMGLYEGYDAMRLLLAKPVLRAEFEADLKKICLGEKNPKTVLQEHIQKYKEAYQQIMERVTAMDENISIRINETPNGVLGEAEENSSHQIKELFSCPKCSTAPLALKQKKDQGAYFIGCQNFPDCKNVIWLPEDCKDTSVLDETCEQCGHCVKLLKVKFKQAYYKTFFNVPSGWYKTCLLCDTKFRQEFNINLDSVKRIGAIVSDVSSINTKPTTKTSASGNIYERVNENLILPGTSNPRARKPTVVTAKTNSNVVNSNTSTINSNSRSYTTAASNVIGNGVEPKTRTSQITDYFNRNNCNNEETSIHVSGTTDTYRNSNNNDISIYTASLIADIETVFEDDDIFNDTIDMIVPIAEPISGTSGSLNRRLTDITSAFNDSSDTIFNDVDLENIAWGTAEHNRRSANLPNAKRTLIDRPTILTCNDELNDTCSNYNWGSSTTTSRQKETVNCSGCHQLAKECSVKKDGPNKGKLFYVCPKGKPCQFFKWKDEDTQTHNQQTPLISAASSSGVTGVSPTATAVNCNCNVAARSLTVRKEGPNKGRPFHACASRSCGFFQWSDQNSSTASTSMMGRDQTSCAWGTAGGDAGCSTSENNTAARRRNQRDNKKRKCGLCRQEGHTKLKCPRKADFEF